MTSELATPAKAPPFDKSAARGSRKPTRPKASPFTTLAARGEPMVWLTGGALAVAVVMVFGLLGFVVYQGIGTFWPQPVVRVTTVDGNVYLGEIARSEVYRPEDRVFAALPKEAVGKARAAVAAAGGQATRRLYRVGNFELTQAPFHWVDDFAASDQERPQWAMVVERLEHGRYYGELQAMLIDGKVVADTPDAAWKKFTEVQPEVRRRWREAVSLDKHELGAIHREEKRVRLAKIQAGLDYGEDSRQDKEAGEEVERVAKSAREQSKSIQAEIDKLHAENARYQLRLKPIQAAAMDIPAETIVRAYPANQLGFGDKAGIYFSRWSEFLLDDPRDSNTAGGYFPAIWGTMAMTLIMTIIVVPFGVLAALYLREYAKAGPITSAVRIAINNLAGVPSVVFGAFGLGFFCYGMGKYIDGGPDNPWPPLIWFAAVAAVGLLGVAAFFIGIAGTPRVGALPSQRSLSLRRLSMVLWLVSVGVAVLLVAKTPFFHGFFRASLADNDPTFNKGGLLWASLTLALLTAPVVIVATEEALAAVPNSMREGSYACGGSKWQTIRRIVLPRALPGILTGMILAMARGAGEVAPLMLVGVKKYTPELPLDSVFPYVHPDRSFMHLAYMIYDVGFQSPDSEAARPMLFTTTLLLIAIVAFANLTAIWLRKRLRRKFINAQF
ncbi:MAG TPA: ABC transporter permease subunit [Pirellulales bacterium]|jgi:ABC-type phosphate transport system permease subunit|nr:ABC transporter permease subunit [Pirellulales bacterium]